MSQNTAPVAIVYGYHQTRMFEGLVEPENVIPFRLIHLLKDRAPSVIYRTGLGKSALAWRMLARLEELAWEHGTEIVHERQLRITEEETPNQ
ncbi:hypothetical protein FDI80_gp51 [Streptomyces phage Aaronocolus]|uniref:Uncharacterized protein n=9 Tax=Likavirus TaxID=1982880 RepID=A0A411CVI2_9CAUD|nr:hypothetical protein AVT22_gp50 [Streptomyces phage Caliburn]YP_009616476.1 hypothetical protein FDI80_gp51 [Streptomyces phage Aaronocolus]ATE84929.1 hypothetical protein SEA_BEARDEDLADY_51 [Streptomyces phage BeardedLady]ATE85231.1 hypothetical protein SEA_ESPERER_51 [Streptomyces phage Esperer]ATE85454.1 hypothetical protein SEA_OZZIE_50 [Streptomyces phage Ozzie]QAY17326.1 hypothetical protein SEA_INDIGO_50 [Streptomyces phage Indigo]QAY17868.1 hypothetical protein SEA_NERDOS_50 [Strep